MWVSTSVGVRSTSAPNARRGSPPGWTTPAAIVSGSVALVGAGVFIGFGLESSRIYDDLRTRCGATGCGPAERSTAAQGVRDQTIANIGLVAAIVGAAATAAFLLVRAYGPRSASASVPASAGAGAASAFGATF